jgi:3-hydroxyacyl-[acyl-carrier-protein] dehydratase
MTLLNIPKDHPAFAGHFPGSPILPGVVLLQAVMQELLDGPHSCDAHEAWVIEQAKFLHPVSPGDCLTLQVLPNSGRFDFEVRLGDTLVLKGRVAPASPGALA